MRLTGAGARCLGVLSVAVACRSSKVPQPAVEQWAHWPMPNAHVAGLPNPHDYDMSTAGVVVDRITGLMWQRQLSNTFLSWRKAQQQCASLSLAGHHDWRLPSRIELVTLLDSARTQPSIDTDAFPGTPNDWFWTSSPAADDPNAAWYVYFYFGYPKTDDVGNTFSVRCVRTYRQPRELDARYEVRTHDVRDIATGLVWERAPTTHSMSFEGARTYCNGLNLAGQAHWRVPTMTELLTLVDERATAPMIDLVAFPEAPTEAVWTSSTFANGTELAWYVRFDRGTGLYGRLVELFHVRCVL